MSSDAIQEARRQTEICNACRYCEGYCSVFPSMFLQRVYSDGDITQLANLCHNCRGCYYACQYTEPHEFALNLPAAFAEVRHESWKEFAWPRRFASMLDRAGVVISAVLALSFALLFWAAVELRPVDGEGFYAVMSHGLMVAIFLPAFLLPFMAVGVSLIRYWRHVGGGRLRVGPIWQACRDAAALRNLKGGHGDGCNFEDGDRFSMARRTYHQMSFWGFMMCFGSTCSGTLLHYGFGLEAPYSWYSLPKLLGVPGGLILCLGTGGLAWLKVKADPSLGAAKIWGGEMAFVLLLFGVSATGLALYAATGTGAVAWLLPIHLGAVLAFFLTTPYSKMAHGFYRLAAMVKDAGHARWKT